MPPEGNYRSDFNYADVYGSNPWPAPTKRVNEWLEQMGAMLYGSPAQNQTSSSTWGTKVARPGDSAVQDYMSHVMGGQRNMLRDYVKQAAGAGIKRGGMNVVGGPALDSALHKTAMDNLARGYGDRFREAMNYNKYLKGAEQSQRSQQLSNFQNLLNAQHRYLSSQAGWQDRLGDRKHSDWQDDVTWNRGGRDRDWQDEQRKWARRDRVQELTRRKEERDREFNRRQDINRIEAAMDGPFGPRQGYMGSRDLNQYGRAMVEEGIWGPLRYTFPKPSR